MIIFFIILILVALSGLKKSNQIKYDYMSIELTNSIKGFFLWMVFLSHIWTYTNFSNSYLDSPYQLIRRLTGQCIVTMFLFYSGYGIMESIKKKGKNYIHKIPIYRFFNVLLQFDCAIILFWIYRYLINTRYSPKTILLTFIGWASIGNSNWYIFCILWLYIFTFISFMIFKNNYIKSITGVITLSLLYMAIMCNVGKEYWWYDTILCYSWGMLFSLYRTKVEKFINETFSSWLFFLLVFFVGYMTIYFYKSLNQIVYQLWVFCFIAVIITFTMRFVITNKFLQWTGSYLFELYILQRLSMIILTPYILPVESTTITKYIYVLTCIIFTLVISIIFKRTISKIIKKIVDHLYNFFKQT